MKSRDIKKEYPRCYVNMLKTLKKKYGVENPSQSSVIQARIKKNSLKKRGVSHFAKDPAVKEKRKKTCLERYGVDNVFKNPDFHVHEKGWEAVQKKYGVPYTFLIPRVQRIVKEKLPETLRKCAKSACRKPNKVEQAYISFFPPYIKYTGNGKFFIRFKTGRLKNPDFVVRPFRKWKKVIEVFGVHWHSFEEESFFIRQYEEVGVRCLVIWEGELEDLEKLQGKLDRFLQIPPPSETVR